MGDYQHLNSIDYQGGINLSASPLSPASQAALSGGSYNAITSGDGFVRPYSGQTSQGAGTGSRKLIPFGATWGGIADYAYTDNSFSTTSIAANEVTTATPHGYITGLSVTTSGAPAPTGLPSGVYYLIVTGASTLKFASNVTNALLGTALPISSAGAATITLDVSNSAVTASGSWMLDVGNSRWGIGAGQPMIAGVPVPGFSLSTNLQVQIPTSGVYGPPVQAGLSQPSAPEVGIIAVTGDMSNSMSAKIARSRPATGAVSLASECSAVIFPQANRMRVTFPIAATGQTHWRAFFPFQGFGGTGVHYLGTYAGDQDISEATVAAGTVDGIARSLEFNFKDGDLIPIEASFDDYAPPAATQAIRLNTVMNLAGCFADSAADPTSTSTGTCIAVSKENNYESYVPTSLLYLPEPVVDVLARPIDDYGFIGCQNSIHAIQYVGNRGDDLPSCTITTILPDIGIEYLQNWCHFRGQLLVYTAQGTLILMDENGGFDTSFANPVSKLLKGWTTAQTSVGYDPGTDSIIVLNNHTMLAYSMQKGQWRQIWLPDYGITGTTLSCTTARRALYFTITDGSVKTAYTYGTGSDTAPLSFVCNYQTNPGGNGAVKDIYEMAVSAESGATTDFAVSISSNRTNSVFRRVSISSGVDNISCTDEVFYPAMAGKKVLLFADGITTGNDYFQGLVGTYVSPTDIVLTDLSGNPFDPDITATELLMFVGDYNAVTDFDGDHFPNFFPNLAEMRSYSIAFWFKGAEESGNLLTCDLFGAAYASSRAL